MRGKLIEEKNKLKNDGITPAHAGKTPHQGAETMEE